MLAGIPFLARGTIFVEPIILWKVTTGDKGYIAGTRQVCQHTRTGAKYCTGLRMALIGWLKEGQSAG